MNTPVVSDSATSHSFRFSYNQSSPGQVDLSVSYQNGNCYDVERRVYEGKVRCVIINFVDRCHKLVSDWLYYVNSLSSC